MKFFSNFNLIAVVSVSFALQIWSHHNTMFAKFLKTSLMPFSDCLMLLAVSTVPLVMIEIMKWFRNRRRDRSPDREQLQGTPTA
jgi:Ca2+-transporting ATPase